MQPQSARLLYPSNSPSKNTGVSCHFLLQGLNPGLLHCGQILYTRSHQEIPRILGGSPIPSPADLPNPGFDLGSPELQADSLSYQGNLMESIISPIFYSERSMHLTFTQEHTFNKQQKQDLTRKSGTNISVLASTQSSSSSPKLYIARNRVPKHLDKLSKSFNICVIHLIYGSHCAYFIGKYY